MPPPLRRFILHRRFRRCDLIFLPPSWSTFPLLVLRRLLPLALGFERPFSLRSLALPPFPRGEAKGAVGGSFDEEDPVPPKVTVRKDGDQTVVDGLFDEEDPVASMLTVLADSDLPSSEG